MKTQGFILQASYRVVPALRGRATPVVYLYGRLQDGGTFLVRDDRQRPHFHIRTLDGDRAHALRITEAQPTIKRTFAGCPVSRVEVETPSDVPNVRDRLHRVGIDTFEADVR